PQEYQNDQHDRHDHLDNGDLQIADRAMNKFRTIVDGNDLDAFRQSGRDVGYFLLHAADHVHRVLAAAHHHDAGNHFSLAVQIGDTTPQFRPFHHLTHVLDADSCAIGARRQHDVAELFRGGRIAAATNHVFGAAKFQKPPAYFLISAAHRLDDAPDRNPVGLQPVGIYVDLKLPRVPADWRHLGDAGYRAQVVAEIPVLVGAQIR